MFSLLSLQICTKSNNLNLFLDLYWTFLLFASLLNNFSMLLTVLDIPFFAYSRLLFSETNKLIYHLVLFAAKILFQMFSQFVPDFPHHNFRCSTAIFDFPAAIFHSPTASFCLLIAFLHHHPRALLLYILHLHVADWYLFQLVSN